MKNARGGGTNPNGFANGEKGMMKPIVIIKREVATKNVLGLLSIKGLLPVRMMCMTSVCVQSDSKNQQV